MKVLATNKKASFDYELIDKYEAGLSLTGVEVKSIKNGRISINESFVTIKGEELYLTNANVSKYKYAGNVLKYDPTRPRKLLLRKDQIKTLIGKSKSQGLTLVPVRVYTKNRLVKLEFSLAKGKKKFDKRDSIAKKETRRRVDRALKNRMK